MVEMQDLPRTFKEEMIDIQPRLIVTGQKLYEEAIELFPRDLRHLLWIASPAFQHERLAWTPCECHFYGCDKATSAARVHG